MTTVKGIDPRKPLVPLDLIYKLSPVSAYAKQLSIIANRFPFFLDRVSQLVNQSRTKYRLISRLMISKCSIIELEIFSIACWSFVPGNISIKHYPFNFHHLHHLKRRSVYEKKKNVALRWEMSIIWNRPKIDKLLLSIEQWFIHMVVKFPSSISASLKCAKLVIKGDFPCRVATRKT